MKILFLVKQYGDYLADQVLYGLRKKYGADCIDFPQKEIMYKDCQIPRVNMYANGFTTWKLLDDIEIDRKKVFEMIAEPVKTGNLNKAFDVIIFGRIFLQQELYVYLKKCGVLDVKKTKFVFLDGEDDQFPIVEEALRYGTYFKRENPYKNEKVKRIGFSIPSEKISKAKFEKKRIFSTHVQCEEAFNIQWVKEYCTNTYAFNNEEDFYHDLDISKYAITMKKGAWDRMKHYEAAAHWAVNCFYKLEDKPEDTAPWGLVDGVNCLSFRTADELFNKINDVEKNKKYDELQENSYKWVNENTSEKMAEYVMNNI